jgi:hypothetical protein
MFDRYGATPLSLCGSSVHAKELYSLLLEFGANEDVMDGYNLENLLVGRALQSQPNEELLKRTLQHEPATRFGDALHSTLQSILYGHSLVDQDTAMKDLHDAILDKTSTFSFGKEGLQYLWSALEDLTPDQRISLELFLGGEQLKILLAFKDLDPRQRPEKLDLTLELGEIEYVYGREKVERLLNNEEIVTTSKKESLDILKAPQDEGDLSSLEPRQDNNAQAPNRYWKDLFKLQLGS